MHPRKPAVSFIGPKTEEELTLSSGYRVRREVYHLQDTCYWYEVPVHYVLACPWRRGEQTAYWQLLSDPKEEEAITG